MLNEEYIEELSVLIGLGFVLLLSKILSCCYSLGLYQKHKEIKLRKDSVMISETNYFYSWTSNLHIYFNENKTKCDDRWSPFLSEIPDVERSQPWCPVHERVITSLTSSSVPPHLLHSMQEAIGLGASRLGVTTPPNEQAGIIMAVLIIIQGFSGPLE